MRTTRRATSWLAAPAVSAVTVFVAGHTFYAALANQSGITNTPLGTAAHVGLRALVLPLVLMALVQYFVNGLAVATLIALKKRRPVWAYWSEGYLWTSWTFFAAAVAALVVYEAIMRFGAAYVVLSVPVIWASYGSYKKYFQHVNEAEREADEMGRIHLRPSRSSPRPSTPKQETHATSAAADLRASKGMLGLFGRDHGGQGGRSCTTSAVAVPDPISTRGQAHAAELDG